MTATIIDIAEEDLDAALALHAAFTVAFDTSFFGCGRPSCAAGDDA